MNAISGAPSCESRTADTTDTFFDEILGSTFLERDTRGLARMGKSQVLKVSIIYFEIY
jgi:hypothetical protein